MVLNKSMNCSMSDIEELISKIELYRLTQNIFDAIVTPEVWGSQDNLHQYWKQNVEKTCAYCFCPDINEIKREVIAFPPRSDICSCS